MSASVYAPSCGRAFLSNTMNHQALLNIQPQIKAAKSGFNSISRKNKATERMSKDIPTKMYLMIGFTLSTLITYSYLS